MYSLYKNTSHIVLVHYLLLSGWKIENKQIEIVKSFYMGFYKGFAFYMTFFPKKSNSSDDQFFSTFQCFINIYLFNFTPDRNVNKFYLHKAKSKGNF